MLQNFLFFYKLIWLKATGKTSPLTVIFNVTNRCNLRCKHCYAAYYDRSPKNEMTADEIKKLILDLKKNGCLRINFAGGEPLLRPDIGKLVNFVKSQGLGVDLTSNGILVPVRLDDIKNINCLTVSLDGRPENHDILRGKGSAEKALSGIKAALLAGIDVRVNMVVHKYNLGDINYMVNLAKKLGIKLHISLAISNIFEDKPIFEIKPTNDQYRKVLRQIISLKKKGAPIFFSAESYQSVLDCWKDFNIEGVIGAPAPPGMPPCPAGKMFGLMDADGRFWACPHLIDKVKAKNALKVGVAKAWEQTKDNPCTGCYQVYHHEYGLLANLKLPVLWNYIKAAAGVN